MDTNKPESKQIVKLNPDSKLFLLSRIITMVLAKGFRIFMGNRIFMNVFSTMQKATIQNYSG